MSSKLLLLLALIPLAGCGPSATTCAEWNAALDSLAKCREDEDCMLQAWERDREERLNELVFTCPGGRL